MKTKVYFEESAPDMIAAYFPDDGYFVKSMQQLHEVCFVEYGEDFELIEVTDENRDQLRDDGLFENVFL